MILGLDLSTSISGLTVIDDVGKVLHCSHIDLKKFDSLYNKTEQVRFILKQIIFDNYTLKPDKVFIESSLLTFEKAFKISFENPFSFRLFSKTSFSIFNV